MRSLELSSSGRRFFLKRAGLSLAALPFASAGLFGCTRSGGGQPVASASAAEAPAWSIRLTSADEPGEPLMVSGRLVASDGVTPLEGLTLYVYHTDARGLYSESDGNGQPPQPRIKGRMTTDRDGRYEFRTIKPASYPGGGNRAHIHTSVSGRGLPERWIDNYIFADDPLVTSDVRARFEGLGRFSPVLTLTRAPDGVLRGVRDIRVERAGV